MNREQIIAHFGIDFYRRLIEKLATYSAKWQLESIEQIDYYSVNCLFTCTSKEYGPCVLKIGKPRNETKTEYQLLNEYAGTRFCRVYEADTENGVLLIERIIPGTQLRAVSDINKRLDIFCEVYKSLHRKPINEAEYPTYLDWVSRIAAYMRDKKEYFALSAYMTDAEQICRELCEKYNNKVLLHGDLHHDNILLGSDNRYRIIDPKGVVGDRVFDIPRFILNEFEDEINEGFVAKYQFIIETLSKKLSIPKADLLKLVFMEMCMENCWNVESNEAPTMKDVEFTKEMLLRGM